VLLKLSGEALQGNQGHGIELETLNSIAEQLVEISEMGVQVAVVLGGGNLYRGLAGATAGMDRSNADTMGMMATVINCLAMEDALLRRGQGSRVFTALPVGSSAAPFSRREVIFRLNQGEVVLLAGGTGNPYFTTDSAAALRSLEVSADVLLKATKVDGIYDKDPTLNKDAKRFDTISYKEVLDRRLKIMDLTAVTLCRENQMPLVVFDLTRKGNIKRVVLGEAVGTHVVEEEE